MLDDEGRKERERRSEWMGEGETLHPGSPQYKMGLQHSESEVHRVKLGPGKQRSESDGDCREKGRYIDS